MADRQDVLKMNEGPWRKLTSTPKPRADSSSSTSSSGSEMLSKAAQTMSGPDYGASRRPDDPSAANAPVTEEGGRRNSFLQLL